MIGYIKASDTTEGDEFGDYVRLSDDGLTLAIGADEAGVYLFGYNDGWTQTAHVGTDVSGVADIDLSGDGSHCSLSSPSSKISCVVALTSGTARVLRRATSCQARTKEEVNGCGEPRL